MKYYMTRKKFQEYLLQHYDRFGDDMSFLDLMQYLYENNLLLTKRPAIPSIDMADELSDEEFLALLQQFPIIFHASPERNSIEEDVYETDIIPEQKDVYVLEHFRHIKNGIHQHNYFEVHYLFKGSCKFIFEKESRILKEGELCIIAPFSKHDNMVADDSVMISMLIRKSTFNTTFFTLLSKEDLLSHFFRTVLYDSSQSNYLLFFTENTAPIKRIIKNLTLENNKYDIYSNTCCISWINLLFSIVLRHYSQTVQFYNYEMGSDFSLVLQYIQHNYHSVTLSELSQLFHYSEPYLSTLIRKNTGHTFSQLLKQLRMSDAVNYLMNSDMKISEIAQITGYKSLDHFSRTFRSYYQMSPQKYRQKHKPGIELPDETDDFFS